MIGKKIDKNNLTISLNVMYTKKNNLPMCEKCENNSKCENMLLF